ncbi:uncharacterized protein LOC144650764 [Oculina patagonica]
MVTNAKMSMNVWMKTRTTVRMNSTSVSTLAARTSVNVNKTCTLSMGHAEFEWDFETDKSFKEKLAFVTTDYCSDNRTRCALKEARRNRRSPLSDLYTADQVHLLPGYPSNTSGSLQVAFYVQQPLGLYIGSFSVLPRDTLVHIVTTHKSVLETAIGANISDIEAWFKPTAASPTAGPVEPSSNDWKWIAIGVSVGVVVIIIIIVIVFWCLKKKRESVEVKPERDDLHDHQEGIHMKSYGQSVSSLEQGVDQEKDTQQT